MFHPVLVQFLVQLRSIRLLRRSFYLLNLFFRLPYEFGFLSEPTSQFFSDCLANLLNQVSIHFQPHRFSPLWLLLDVLELDCSGPFARDGRSAGHGVVALLDLFLLVMMFLVVDLAPRGFVAPCFFVV